jgi:NDP-sugar pyrophosphorylase family protein
MTLPTPPIAEGRARRAVILAGGLGARLRPYTVSLPKPLMPVGEFPILEIIVRQLALAGFGHITLAVNHQAELMRAYFGDGARWGLHIDYSLETKPLGTMGPLCLVEDLPEHFLVMNGDILSDLNYAAFLTEHARDNRLFSVSAARREQKIDYGVLHGNDEGRLVGFEEKPTVPYLVSMGVYGLSRRVLQWIPQDHAFGFDQLVLKLLADSEPVDIRVHAGYWLDIGRPDDYQRAVDEWPTLRTSLGI